MELEQIIDDVGVALSTIDQSGVAFKHFQLGIGPYGEPQLVGAVANLLNTLPYNGLVRTKRTPDLLIRGAWALEFKVARPFGDNGRETENFWDAHTPAIDCNGARVGSTIQSSYGRATIGPYRAIAVTLLLHCCRTAR